MTEFRSVLPLDQTSWYQSIYDGALYHLEATQQTLALVQRVSAELETILGRQAHAAQFQLSPREFFERIGDLRRKIYESDAVRRMTAEIMSDMGLDLSEQRVDPIRLRAVTHLGHANHRATAMYYAHRDTWYANPSAQVNWWIPLHDVSADATFVFFPDQFLRPVENDSEKFDYVTWIQKDAALAIGWQDYNAGQKVFYPCYTGQAALTHAHGFSCRAGDIILFSGTHLHQTVPNMTGMTRFSLDFRTVHYGDFQSGRGAPNVDNASRGVAERLRTYIRLEQVNRLA